MKKIIYYFVILGFVAFSCAEDRANREAPKNLNLLAPSGERIASGMQELNKITAGIVTEKFGTYKKFAVTGITYMAVRSGYVAQIHYTVDDTYANNYFISNTQPGGANAKADCIRWSGSCSGSSCCSGGYDTGSGNYSCSCSGGGSGCTITLKCIEQM